MVDFEHTGTFTGDDAFSLDRFFNGKILVKQDKSGYRFSIDAVLLAGSAHPEANDRVLDLGTGCGIIPLLMAHARPNIKIWGVEIQQALGDLARENIFLNRMDKQIEIIVADMRGLGFDRVKNPVDLVVCNPPYHPTKNGKINPDAQKAIARHEIFATLSDVIATAGRFLKLSGRLVLIYPAERLVDLLLHMREFRIEPKKMQMIHSHSHAPAKLVIVEGMKGGGPEVKVADPLFIYKADGSYTNEVQKMMTGSPYHPTL